MTEELVNTSSSDSIWIRTDDPSCRRNIYSARSQRLILCWERIRFDRQRLLRFLKLSQTTVIGRVVSAILSAASYLCVLNTLLESLLVPCNSYTVLFQREEI